MLNISDTGDERYFVLKGDNISAGLSQLEDALNSFTREDKRNAVIDLRNVTRIDSMSLAAIIRVKNRLASTGRSLELINPTEGVLRVLQLAGLDEFLMD